MRRPRIVCDRHHFFAHLTPIRRAKRPDRPGPGLCHQPTRELLGPLGVRSGKAQSASPLRLKRHQTAGYFRCGPQGPGSPSAEGGEPSLTGGRLGRNGAPLPGAGCDPPHGPAAVG
jgi:hypothetical protein